VKKSENYLLLHFIVFIWGWTAILGKLITISASDLVWYRTLIAACSIFLFLKATGATLQTSRQGLLKFLSVGVVVAIHWIFFYEAVKINVSLGLVCFSSGTFFVSLIEPFLYKRRIIWYEVVFGLIVFGIIYLISDTHIKVKPDLHYLLDSWLKPNAAVVIFSLIGAFTSALFAVLNGKLVQQHDPKIITFYEMIGGFLFLSLYFLAGQHFSLSFFHLSPSDTLWLLILGIACTAFTFVASVAIMRVISPYTVVLSVNLEPVYGIILAWFIFKDEEKMNLRFYVQTAVILALVFMNAVFKNYTRRKTAAEVALQAPSPAVKESVSE
jgi:drug/metabolite transporter (DMT)-like permease